MVSDTSFGAGAHAQVNSDNPDAKRLTRLTVRS